MFRSNLAITRLIILPYCVLLILYLAVIGGGGAWLYYQVREAEARLLINEMMTAIEPLANKLRKLDSLDTVIHSNQPWVEDDVRSLFTQLPALRNVTVRNNQNGVQMDSVGPDGAIASHAVSPLADTGRQKENNRPHSRRLYTETNALFVIQFDTIDTSAETFRLEYAFDREMLMHRIDNALTAINQSIMLFGAAGLISILIALFITVIAIRNTRLLENYFQEIYQRASLAETGSYLVHDLRNHLAALRANGKALLVSPQQTQNILEDMDDEIVKLNDKLSDFLKYTRQPGEKFTPVDISQLIEETIRLAEPWMHQHGLAVETVIPPHLPQLQWQKEAMRDALLNLLINAAQSGQHKGTVRLTVNLKDHDIWITVEDRGNGFEQQHLPHIFKAFYTTRKDGNGLGLAIVKRIVTLHQGRIYAENRTGGGARIVIVIPIQQKETPAWWKKFKRNSQT